ncbi:MAG TPA: hypothetical protein VFQ67_04705 [Allosphingosinicella sp.]|jgi:hypothetical protein|nr:hypothetical protein [Allosphingosinicella sp.]
MKILQLAAALWASVFAAGLAEAQEPSINEQCREIAGFFVAKSSGTESLPFADKLNSSKLDYSVASLDAVDRYLEHVHRNNGQLKDLDEEIVVVWGGCYLGEVIRRNSARGYVWEKYASYAEKHPQVRQVIPEATTGTMILLSDSHGRMTLPLNKVGRFIFEGPSNNLRFYAEAEIAS